MVCHLVTCNKCLRFDRREELEAGTFDFSKSPAYPVLGVSELNGVASRTRVVQILTEGRAIRNEDRAQTIQERLLVNLGYASDTPHLDFGPFRAALASFRDAYCSGTIGKGRAKKWPLSNRKIVKLFALREFSYLANLFSLAEIAMRVSPKQLITGDAIPLISSPSILKIASFASPLGVFGMFAQALGQGPIEQMEKLLAEDYKDLPEGDRGFIDPILASNREGNLITYLRAFILPVLSKFDSLLQSLHDEDSLAAFDEWASDTATWSAIPLFKRILDRRNAMVEGLRTFAGELRKLLAIIEQHGYVTHDADESLKQVTDYKLQLSSTY